VSVLRGGASGTKLLSIGSLFGGTLTVGLAALLLSIGPTPQVPPARSVAPSAAARPAFAPAPQAAIREHTAVSAEEAKEAKPSHSGAPSAKPRSTPARVTKPHLAEDSLAREASLVSEARNALEHGNPELALRAIRAARALRSHQLVPEELAVEEQALRAIGQSDEANGIDVQLRLQYPESALAR
jgi:hypothetical protein